MVPTFDAWSATFEEARAAEDAVPGNEIADPGRPLFQWIAVQTVNTLRTRIERGDGAAVLDAISQCVWHRLVAPGWLAREYLKRYRAVQVHYLAASWDDPQAFGPPHRKRVNLALARRRRMSSAKLHGALIQVLRSSPPDVAIDRILWERVGSLIGESGSQAEKLYQANIKGRMHLTAEVLRSMHAGADANHGNGRSRG